MFLKRMLLVLGCLIAVACQAAEYYVDIDKNRMTLTLLEVTGTEQHDSIETELLDTLFVVPISCGRNLGPKQHRGDMRTPEGVFRVTQIQESYDWGHDFHDGLGFIDHAYGPWFFRLSSGYGIGIHGTHAPESMGLRATEGCIRLRNEDLRRLRPYMYVGLFVTILPDTFTPIKPLIRPLSVPADVGLPPVEPATPFNLRYVRPARRRHRR